MTSAFSARVAWVLWASTLAACGTRSAVLEADGGGVDRVVFADTDAGRRTLEALDGDPEGPILEGSRCVGFGFGPPVVQPPPQAQPGYCGLDCSDGDPCPDGHRCWAVYQRSETSGGYDVSRDILAYQCFPADGGCGQDAQAGAHCGRCDDDAQCR